jgi:hypothetical protein
VNAPKRNPGMRDDGNCFRISPPRSECLPQRAKQNQVRVCFFVAKYFINFSTQHNATFFQDSDCKNTTFFQFIGLYNATFFRQGGFTPETTVFSPQTSHALILLFPEIVRYL